MYCLQRGEAVRRLAGGVMWPAGQRIKTNFRVGPTSTVTLEQRGVQGTRRHGFEDEEVRWSS